MNTPFIDQTIISDDAMQSRKSSTAPLHQKEQTTEQNDLQTFITHNDYWSFNLIHGEN